MILEITVTHKTPSNTIRSAAIVVAAGLSSRMGAFKPLLTIDGIPLIAHVVNRLISAAVDHIVVVAGYQADTIIKTFEGNIKVSVVINPDYDRTHMFDSIKIGVSKLMEIQPDQTGHFFLVPGDIPLFNPRTLVELKSSWEREQHCLICKPIYRQKSGHPILISNWIRSELLSDTGSQGLKGFIESKISEQRRFDPAGRLMVEVAVPDPGILLDADTPADYVQLCAYSNKKETPDLFQCYSLLRFYQTPRAVIKHCKATTRQAIQIAQSLSHSKALQSVRIDVVRAAALLHDIAKAGQQHAHVGAEWLREWGINQIADIVEVHMDLPEQEIPTIDEASIVYLADKRTLGERTVELGWRLKNMEKQADLSVAALSAARRKIQQAELIEQAIIGTT
jgi:putative nucleotidyltransferase with HDIG domain